MLSAIILKLAQRLKRRLRGLLKKLSNRKIKSAGFPPRIFYWLQTVITARVARADLFEAFENDRFSRIVFVECSLKLVFKRNANGNIWTSRMATYQVHQ